MWNRKRARCVHRWLSLLLACCLLIQSSPVMAGPARPQAAAAAQPYRPPRSPGYLPPARPNAAPAAQTGDLPPSPPAADAPDMRQMYLPLVAQESGASDALSPQDRAGRFTGAVELAPGWNLLSLPEEPPSTSVDNVFTAIGGKYSRVFAYDGCEAADPWREYDPANAGESDLTAVDFRRGLWLQTTEAVALPVAGTAHLSTTLALCAGWNLIGYPLATPQLTGAALASIAGKYSRVVAYDAFDIGGPLPDPWEVHNTAAPAWANDLAVMYPGRGYWLYATEDVTLTFVEPASYDLFPPTVAVTATPGTVAVGEAVLLTLTASDNAVVTSRRLTVNGAEVPLDRGGQHRYTPDAAGLYTVTASAEDGVGNVATAVAYFRARGAIDNGPPVVALLAPADDTVILAQSAVVGTATDDDFAFYTLEAKPADGATYAEFARGFTVAVSETVGTLTAGMFLPGLHDIRLCAEDSWGNRACTPARRYDFASQVAPPGVMRFGALDAEAAAAGIPLRISRVYDSRNKVRGDFGIGWRMDVSEVRLYANRFMGNDWQQVFIPGVPVAYGLAASADHRVTAVLPDGTIHRFRMKPRPEVQAVARITALDGATFEPISNTTSSLVAVEQPAFVDSGAPTLNNPVDALLLDGGFNIYSPANYRLTLANGVRLDFVRNGALNVLTYRLAKITEPNGATVTIAANGITHSAGIGITITRDGLGRVTAIRNPKGDSRTYTYDARGRLVVSRDWDGYETRYTYDDRDNLIAVIDPRGFTPGAFVYDAAGRIAGILDSGGFQATVDYDATGDEVVTDSNGRTTITRYDDRGRPIQITDALGGVTRYSYDDRDNLLSKTDPLGATTAYAYDARNNKIRETDALGHTTTLTYDANDRLLTQTDPLGRTTSYAYDARGNLLSVTDALGNVVKQQTYDGRGNVIATSNAISATARFQYDAVGRRTVVTTTVGAVERSAYDANGRLTGLTDARGVSSTLTLDKRGNFVQVLNSLGTLARFNWDARGELAEVIDPTGQVARTVYDEKGRAIQEINSDGSVAARAFDVYNNVVATTDAAGRTTANTYDALNRLIQTVAPDGATVELTYDAAGRRTATVDPRGNRTQIAYDALGRSTVITDALGGATRFTYDAAGNVVGVTDPAGRTFATTYDALNRVVGQTFPDGRSLAVAYDAAGRVASMTDELGRITHYAYDAGDRLVRVTDPTGGATHYTYDVTGQLLTQTDANGHTTTFTYDAAGRRTSVTYPDGASVRIGYDSLGRTAAITDALGLAVTFEYDAFHRATARLYPDGTRIDYAYDSDGQLATVTDARGVTAYSYDEMGRVAGIDNPDGSSLRYTYDLAGNRATVTAQIAPAAPALTTRFGYDALNRLQAVTDPAGAVTTYQYDANGNRNRIDYANGAYTRYSYDSRNRLTVIEHGKGAAVYERFTYTLDAVGDRTRVDHLDGSRTEYVYDNLRRLVRETQFSAANARTLDVEYRYDAVGNRTGKIDRLANQTTAYAYDAADKLLSSSDARYEYDANGNLTLQITGGVTTTYLYDYDNRLIQVSNSAGSVTTYQYDHERNRVGRVGPAGSVRYLVDPLDNSGLPHVLAEYNGGLLLVNYTYGDDLISQRRGGQASYYHYDGANSTRLLTGGAGAVSDRYRFDAFGVLLEVSGSTVNSFLYSGEQYDANSGFYYLRARYYAPETGRFTSRDLIHGNPNDPVSLHKYLYAHANPVTYGDPTGLFSIPQGLVVASIISGLVAASINYAYNRDLKQAGIAFIKELALSLLFGSLGAIIAKAAVKHLFINILVSFPFLARLIKPFVLAVIDTIKEATSNAIPNGDIPDTGARWRNLGLVFLGSFAVNLVFNGGTKVSLGKAMGTLRNKMGGSLMHKLGRVARESGFKDVFELFGSGAINIKLLAKRGITVQQFDKVDDAFRAAVTEMTFGSIDLVKLDVTELMLAKVVEVATCYFGQTRAGAETNCSASTPN